MAYQRTYDRSKTAERAIAKTRHVVVVKQIQETYGLPGSSGVAKKRNMVKCGKEVFDTGMCGEKELKTRRKLRKKAEKMAVRKKHAVALAGRGAKVKTKRTKTVEVIRKRK